MIVPDKFSPPSTLPAKPRRQPDRLLRTLVLALPLIVAIGLLPKRPSSMTETGIPQRQLYAQKLRWPAAFDVVLAGNSRITVGLSPAEMKSVLPGHQIGNFGFDGNAFTSEYLAAVEAKLRPSTAPRFVVLGVSPLTLTERAARQNGFLEERNRPADERFLVQHAPEVLDFFARFNPRIAVSLLSGDRTVGREFWRGHSDGWAAQNMEPKNLTQQVLFLQANASRDAFPVSPRLVTSLLTTVRRWKQMGIVTIGFRPPTTPELAAEEDRITGFAEAGFIKAFNAAGGQWLEIDPAHFSTFDGGHLEEASALRLSREVAIAIGQWSKEP